MSTVWVECPICRGGLIDRSRVRDGLVGDQYTHLRTGKCEICNGAGNLQVVPSPEMKWPSHNVKE